jgi:hypothetical protein
MTSSIHKTRFRALRHLGFVGIALGFVAIACGSGKDTPAGNKNAQSTQAVPCQQSMQCLNGQSCINGYCVVLVNNVPPGSPTPAPTTTTSPPAPGPVPTTTPTSAPPEPPPAPTNTTPTPPPEPPPPVCKASLDACTSNGDCCGFSTHANYCVNTGTSLGAICAIACTSDSECKSGCCAPLKSGGSVCAPSSQCQTTCTGGDLDSCSKNSDCCGYASGHNYCVNTGGALGAICAISCTSGSQCSSGCCAPLTGGGAVCAPSSACGG